MMKFLPLLAILSLAACAKYPDTGSAGETKRLIFKMRTAGPLRGTEGGLPYVYRIALRLSTELNPTTTGPIPIVVPGGNGFVAGNATHFIEWNPQQSPQFQIYQFRDETLEEWFPTGIPINFIPVANGDRELTFEIDMSQLIPANQVDSIQTIQVNFLTMNSVNNTGGGRFWDALGDGRLPSEVNRYFQFQPRTSTEYTNQNQGNVEPTGDTEDPQLDIDDWSIEVRLP